MSSDCWTEGTGIDRRSGSGVNYVSLGVVRELYRPCTVAIREFHVQADALIEYHSLRGETEAVRKYLRASGPSSKESN